MSIMVIKTNARKPIVTSNKIDLKVYESAGGMPKSSPIVEVTLGDTRILINEATLDMIYTFVKHGY